MNYINLVSSKKFPYILVADVDHALDYLKKISKSFERQRIVLISDLDQVYNEGFTALFLRKKRKIPNMWALEVDMKKLSNAILRLRNEIGIKTQILDIYLASDRVEEYEQYSEGFNPRALLFRTAGKFLFRTKGVMFNWRFKVLNTLRNGLNKQQGDNVLSFAICPNRFIEFDQFIKSIKNNVSISTLLTNCGKSRFSRWVIDTLWKGRRFREGFAKTFLQFLNLVVEIRQPNIIIFIDSNTQTLDEFYEFIKNYPDIQPIYISINPKKFSKLAKN